MNAMNAMTNVSNVTDVTTTTAMTAAWRRGVLRGGSSPPGPLVVKLGGSLLARAGWPADVAAMLDPLPAPRLVVVGGGPLVDGLREIDRAAPQPAELMHRLAIACMGHTARVVAATLAVPLVGRPESAPSSESAATAVLDSPTWLAHDGHKATLPIGWQVTSDSIAATVAATLGGGLLLVKSVAPPAGDVTAVAAAGWVDAFFPAAAAQIPWIGWAAPATPAAPPNAAAPRPGPAARS